MSLNKFPFGRYQLIDAELSKRAWVKTRDLKSLIEERLGLPISERQIQKDIEAMQNDSLLGYYAPIEYDNNNKAYKYTDRNYSIRKFNLKDEELVALKFYAASINQYKEHGLFSDFSNVLQKVVEAVDIKSKINPSANTKMIVQTDNVVSIIGGHYLGIIAQAIDRRRKVKFLYTKFEDLIPNEWIVAPYLIKEYKNRWYLICKADNDGTTRTFGLDRITALEPVDEVFQIDANFDPEKLFKYSFGITTLEDKPLKIILLFTPLQGKYVKSLPIHASQVILREDSKGLKISIEVIPSYELYEYLLSQGDRAKIISPKRLKQKVKAEHEAAFTAQ